MEPMVWLGLIIWVVPNVESKDHYNTFTEYSLRQVLEYSDFSDIDVFPLNLYVFWKNPLNYVLLFASTLFSLFFRAAFIMYGKHNRLFTKKIAAVCTNVG